MQVVYNKLWLAELHNIVDSLKIPLQPKRKWRRLVHYILNGIVLRAKCCILVQISMTYDSKVQMTKCLRWFCLWFVFLTGDILFLESMRMTTQFKNTCHQASVISYCFQAGSWYDHQGKSLLLTTRIGYIISSICLYIYQRWACNCHLVQKHVLNDKTGSDDFLMPTYPFVAICSVDGQRRI